MSGEKRKRRRRKKEQICSVCGAQGVFCWHCRDCGFMICQACMDENAWGITCNNLTWECPDCGSVHSF